jgi:hypothetical protein
VFCLGGVKSFVSFRIFFAGFFLSKNLKSCVFCLGGVKSFVRSRIFLLDFFFPKKSEILCVLFGRG